MFDKEYWRKREEEVMERQNKEMKNVYKQLKNGEVTLTSKAKTMAGVWDMPKEIQTMASEMNNVNYKQQLEMLKVDMGFLEVENKGLKASLYEAQEWLVRILNNDENASDFQKYMREEFGEVIK